MEIHMDTGFRIGAVGPRQQDLLARMYERFEPLGVAFGLPPVPAESRRAWIGQALGQEVSVAAFSPGGAIVGHAFLVSDKMGSAELAVFVHQESRRRGVGAALVNEALRWGAAAGLRRVWSMTSSENRAALRLQKRCGFRLCKSGIHEMEMEIDLSVPWGAPGNDASRSSGCGAGRF